MSFTLKPVLQAVVGLILLLALTACGQPDRATSTPSTDLETPITQTAHDEHDLQAAIQEWENTLTDNPSDPQAEYQLSLLYLILDPDAVQPHLDQAESLQPALSVQVSRLKSALRQARAVDDRAYQLTIAGQALASISEWPLAETALEMAIIENPDYAEAWAYLGEARQQTNSPGALEALQTARALKPDGFSVNLFLGIYYRRAGDPAAALPHLITAAAQDPTSLELQADLAQTEVEAGQVSQAFERLYPLLEANPEDPDRWLAIARLCIENDLQVTSDGLPAARQAAVLAPEAAEPVLLIGRAYLLLNEPLLAERFLTDAVDRAPELATPHYYLGILYLNTGQHPAAESHLRAALALARSSRDQAISALAGQLLQQYFP